MPCACTKKKKEKRFKSVQGFVRFGGTEVMHSITHHLCAATSVPRPGSPPGALLRRKYEGIFERNFVRNEYITQRRSGKHEMRTCRVHADRPATIRTESHQPSQPTTRHHGLEVLVRRFLLDAHTAMTRGIQIGVAIRIAATIFIRRLYNLQMSSQTRPRSTSPTHSHCPNCRMHLN